MLPLQYPLPTQHGSIVSTAPSTVAQGPLQTQPSHVEVTVSTSHVPASTETVVGGSVCVQGSAGGTYCGHSLPGVPVLQGSVTVRVYVPVARATSGALTG